MLRTFIAVMDSSGTSPADLRTVRLRFATKYSMPARMGHQSSVAIRDLSATAAVAWDLRLSKRRSRMKRPKSGAGRVVRRFLCDIAPVFQRARPLSLCRGPMNKMA